MAFWGKKKKETDPDAREDRKKVGLFRRLWQKVRNIDWKDPVTRWKVMFISLIGLIVIGGGSYGALAITNSPAFCSSCHEMAPEYSTFTASAHNNITCVQCHIKPGTINMLTHKVKSLKEVYYHVTGVPEQIVQTEDEVVSNENCMQCHSKNRLVTASGDLKVNHKGHIEEGIPCISCHAGVVHAKMAARGINTEEVRGEYTKETAEKIMEKKYLRPNMGTCIDCHDKVNNGEKPWKDVAYLVPPNPEEVEKKIDESKKEGVSEPVATETKTESAVEGTAGSGTAEDLAKVHEEKTQDLILQAIGKQQKDVKISMACETCHRKVKVPKSHKEEGWNQAHGGTAIQELDKCVNCHQDSKWIREIPKEDIISLLKMKSAENSSHKYTANLTVVKDQSRVNNFCSACHGKRPAGHIESDQWLTAHASKAKTADQKAECFVCHDREKPVEGSTTVKAPTDVYCQYCHRTGFKDDVKN
ncbi:NapC/NirT family cytochrome c [Neobacillus citreus]|uniref:NapC/NirT family cytochrome c n=1 Tax=Neobacillus citreus TaxID=2833578 RepID=A0A942T305_9BACI|nr:NapC/NirT family cytochrome c [Neobacillus citreus]MCH6266556.1 NapC/NirT family cytochrome c [Neobacillus citreus]